MAPLPPPRRPSWLPAAVFLAGAILAGVAAAWLLGWRAWWAHLGVVLFVILGLGAAERFLAQRAAPRPPRSRGKLKVIPGGKSAFDIEKDDPENPPRWLM
jgi:hypothetical protein